MKKSVISIFLVLLTVVGWGAFLLDVSTENASGTISEDVETPEQMLATADKWVEERLYQRAMRKYEQYLAISESEEVRGKLLNAYKLRCEEDKKLIPYYVNQLEKAIALYPKNVDFCKTLVDIYSSQGRKERMYNALCVCFKGGMENDDLLKLKKKLRYSGNVSENSYSDFECLSGGMYTVVNNGAWGAINEEGGIEIDFGYEYIGPSGEDYTRVYTYDDECRLIDGTGFVLGIFEKDVFTAGMYQNSLTPVILDDKYCYVDPFAKFVFGDYEMASSFQNGYAAVKKDGKWSFIDINGNAIGKEFSDVVLNKGGQYAASEIVIAADSNGKYGMYDLALNKIGDFSCDGMDICTDDKIIAYKSGDKWGYVDSTGKIVIEPQYENAKSFSNGIAAVCVEGKWGFISPENEIVIPCKYLDADYFNAKGTCMIKHKVEEKVENDPVNGTTESVIKEKWALFVLDLGIREY